jgi:homopolymeric O-antigen transport system permease protein
MLTNLKELVRYRSLLRNLVSRDLKVRYKRSFLGVAWTMMNPLLMMAVFTFVFSKILKVPVQNFTVFFLSAYLLWNFVGQTSSWATGCLLGYAPLIRKIYVPKEVFVIATVLAGLVNLLLSLAPLALIMIVIGHPFRASLWFLPVPMLLATLFALGLGLLLAPLCVLFADAVQIYQVVLTAWFYVTPIMYPMDLVPAGYRRLVWANPMSYLVEAFREPIYGGTLPSLATIGTASIFSLGTLLVGWLVFERTSDRLAYHL